MKSMEGGVIITALLAAASLSGVGYTLNKVGQNQREVVDRLNQKRVIELLSRTLSEAAGSPYALSETAKNNPALANCTSNQTSDCAASALNGVGQPILEPFDLFDASGVEIAGGIQAKTWDRIGRPCTTTSCPVAFRTSAAYVTRCLGGAPTCGFASAIEVTWSVESLQTNPPRIVAQGTQTSGAFECPDEGEVITGFKDGAPVYTAMSISNANTSVNPTTNIPACSNSVGEIPANTSTRPARPRPPVGSAEYLAWQDQGWWAGTGPQGKGDRACKAVAYEYGLHCSNKYNGLASAPGNMVCGDFFDCRNTAGSGTFDCSFIEFDGNCNMSFLGCRGTRGCFSEDTQITLADGSQLPVNEIRVGMEVYNPVFDEARKVIRVVDGFERKPLVRIKVDSKLDETNIIKVTLDHPLDTQAGLLKAKDLRLTDSLVDAHGNKQKILDISAIHGQRHYVWNFEVEGDMDEDHIIVADGLRSGDLYLQNKNAGSP